MPLTKPSSRGHDFAPIGNVKECALRWLRRERCAMLKRLAGSIGKGLFAGAAGTAAMTISSTIEMKMYEALDP